MKYFLPPSSRLSTMPFGLRLVLALYCIVTLIAFWIAGLKYVVRGTLTPSGITTYYLGEEQPGVLLPPEPKDLGFLVDVTHPHLFTVPLVLLVLCHLVHLCCLPEWFKRTLYVTSFVGTLLTFGVPWVLGLAPWLAPMVSIGGGVLLLSGTLLSVLPLRDLRAPRESA